MVGESPDLADSAWCSPAPIQRGLCVDTLEVVIMDVDRIYVRSSASASSSDGVYDGAQIQRNSSRASQRTAQTEGSALSIGLGIVGRSRQPQYVPVYTPIKVCVVDPTGIRAKPCQTCYAKWHVRPPPSCALDGRHSFSHTHKQCIVRKYPLYWMLLDVKPKLCSPPVAE